MQEIYIKDCMLENIEKILEIENSSSYSHWTKNMFLNELSNKNSFFKIAFFNDILIGYIIYRVIIDEAEILNIVIDNCFKGRRFGSRLLEDAIDNLQKLNIKTIFLEAGENNMPAINLYFKFGFKQYSLRKHYYRGKENALLLKKET